MDVVDPAIAQQIVAEYARLIEGQTEWPASVDLLPYPKRTIKSAIHSACMALAASGQLTDELREFLEGAYVSLADYVSADVSRLMLDYQRAGADFANDARRVREKTATDAWRTITDSSQLAGEIARSIAAEAELLRAEFRSFAHDPSSARDNPATELLPDNSDL
jgi:hypothetical protein